MDGMASRMAMNAMVKMVDVFLGAGLRFQMALARSLANKAWWLAKVLSPSKIREILDMMEGITNQLKQVGGIQGGKRSKKSSKKKRSRKYRKTMKSKKTYSHKYKKYGGTSPPEARRVRYEQPAARIAVTPNEQSSNSSDAQAEGILPRPILQRSTPSGPTPRSVTHPRATTMHIDNFMSNRS